MDIMDNSKELTNAQQTIAHQHHNLSHAILLRHPRHYYGRQYFRRKSSNNPDASTSHGKSTPLSDGKLSFKLASQCKSDSGHQTVDVFSEDRERAYSKPERIRSSSLAMDAVSADLAKIVCGICDKPLRRKPCILGNTMSSSDLSVVAILVCRHVYHAECLEQETSHDDRHDPPCPMCGPDLSG